MTETARQAPQERPPARIHPPVFFGSVLLISAFVIFGAGWPDVAGSLFAHVQDRVVDTFGWFYLLVVTGFLLFCFGLAVSSHGNGPARGSTASERLAHTGAAQTVSGGRTPAPVGRTKIAGGDRPYDGGRVRNRVAGCSRRAFSAWIMAAASKPSTNR